LFPYKLVAALQGLHVFFVVLMVRERGGEGEEKRGEERRGEERRSEEKGEPPAPFPF